MFQFDNACIFNTVESNNISLKLVVCNSWASDYGNIVRTFYIRIIKSITTTRHKGFKAYNVF